MVGLLSDSQTQPTSWREPAEDCGSRRSDEPGTTPFGKSNDLHGEDNNAEVGAMLPELIDTSKG